MSEKSEGKQACRVRSLGLWDRAIFVS